MATASVGGGELMLASDPVPTQPKQEPWEKTGRLDDHNVVCQSNCCYFYQNNFAFHSVSNYQFFKTTQFYRDINILTAINIHIAHRSSLRKVILVYEHTFILLF